MQVSVGTALLLPEPRKPNAVLAPLLSVPFQERFPAVTAEPLVVTAALQDWEMLCPDPRFQRTVHPLVPAEPAVTTTLPWNPLFQADTTE